MNRNCNCRGHSYHEMKERLWPPERLAHIYPVHRQLHHFNDAQYLHWRRLCANQRNHWQSIYKTVPRDCYKSHVSCLDRAVLEMIQANLTEMSIKITAKEAVKNHSWRTPFPATELQSPRGSAATLCQENCFFLGHPTKSLVWKSLGQLHQGSGRIFVRLLCSDPSPAPTLVLPGALGPRKGCSSPRSAFCLQVRIEITPSSTMEKVAMLLFIYLFIYYLLILFLFFIYFTYYRNPPKKYLPVLTTLKSSFVPSYKFFSLVFFFFFAFVWWCVIFPELQIASRNFFSVILLGVLIVIHKWPSRCQKQASDRVIDCLIMNPVTRGLNSSSIPFILSWVLQSNVKIQLCCMCNAQTYCKTCDLDLEELETTGPQGAPSPGGSPGGQALMTM